MEKLTVELDCKKKTCGKCKLKGYHMAQGSWCHLFNKPIIWVRGKTFLRLPECIAACKAQNA